MVTKFEKMNKQEDDVVERQGAAKGKKGSSKDFVKIVETQMAKVEYTMSDVLMWVEDTEDSLKEIKFNNDGVSR
ncbi:hypothetical protein GOBAR_AA14884 [Gossypium barbadense]|uniref:Uncharacterized protein n=1 Tax=Gossypium barbadense TaxID=3634 RepID=A0A2P5XR00_GOSBA|nr:hypothetical protein GOBAR_AA14884 [Gossypium barbadense]